MHFQSEEVFTLSLKSDDELFHVAMYEWLIHMNLTEKLLEVCYIIHNSNGYIKILLKAVICFVQRVPFGHFIVHQVND